MPPGVTWNGADVWLMASQARPSKALANRLDDLPLARHHFQRLGDILAKLRQAVGAASNAAGRAGDHDACPRQVRRQWLARGSVADEHGRGLGGGDGGFVLGGGGFGLCEGQLELVDQPLAAFRALTKAVTLEQLDLQCLKCDAGLEIGVDRAGVGGIGASYSGLYFGLTGTHHRDCKLLSERDNIGGR
jgi:hypothetical protein